MVILKHRLLYTWTPHRRFLYCKQPRKGPFRPKKALVMATQEHFEPTRAFGADTGPSQPETLPFTRRNSPFRLAKGPNRLTRGLLGQHWVLPVRWGPFRRKMTFVDLKYLFVDLKEPFSGQDKGPIRQTGSPSTESRQKVLSGRQRASRTRKPDPHLTSDVATILKCGVGSMSSKPTYPRNFVYHPFWAT